MGKETFLQSIETEDYRQFTRELAEEPTIIDSRDENGTWCVFLAARKGNLSFVKYVCEYSRASMNEYDEQHRNILHYGVESGELSVVKYLVERIGMNPLDADKAGVTPYETARKLEFTEIEKYFRKKVGFSLENSYKNPILTGMHPDPSIVRVGKDYYMVNSSFVFFPCIPISHSRDLIHWEVIGHAITNPEWAHLEPLEGGRGYWAPDISYYKGRFYITATYRLNDDGTVYRKQMVTSSEKPEGPYCEPVFLEEDGIDPSIFNDEDGRRYMLLNRGARIFELSADAKRIIGKPRMLWYGDQKRAPEGPHLLKHDGYYYLFLAEGGTGPGHRISVGRSRKLMGPYTPCPYNPILHQYDKDAYLQRCGHGKPVQTDKGEWFMVYLCSRSLQGENGPRSILGRETAMDPITWTADGWPIINEGKGPSALQKKTRLRGDASPAAKAGWITFASDHLPLDFVFPRTLEPDRCRVENGILHLRGEAPDLDQVDCRSVALIRQQHFCFETQVKVDLPELSEGQDAGLTGYYDENTWLKFGVFREKAGLALKVQEWIYPERRDSLQKVIDRAPGQNVILRMETDYFARTFYYSLDEGRSFEKLGRLEGIDYLCDEGLKKGKRFTGAMVGVYVHGGEHSLQVSFEDFRYQA